MPVDEIKPTRSGLLIVRRRMALAERIHRLLKMKLDGMMLELVRLTDQAARERKELEEKYAHAREMAAVATMMEGATGVLLAALSVEAVPTYTTGHKNVFGVHLPDLEPVMVKKTLIQRGYGILGTSSVIDDAADAYEDLISAIIASAELEGGITRLLDDIERTRRRVNALEFKVIPELTDLRRLIEYQRDEMERQDAVRLRRIKKIKAKRRW
ncbi:V-type ATP synthase subunit D [Methanoculleus bourgensis]|jgi:V/A-type H+-transporting ATPase subunit D|uniref:A-type ATP synthase subunit D n=2 Tax=Methanoculleus bourgensis TaxID=83986 RepID=A0A0X3BPG4_9EURY|nr:V-type ATP synthase subunit D [Methanoculleus bourgensis]MBT0732184.1 V-type ATP synthase subunit D [Methanoculleus bourgensis]MDD3373026.1 V-type ATP synthase subunit D [Methanoculleus bourgensis]NMA88021.1 V-type ATP synthase subunit D [Methanoculleus bourgensis]NQS77238.1 V-type ATP synthase subunit D [Methanoculleus bourgensis]CCJ36628.1 V-type H+-transporting ATPase subunit D [Methanoculleus bourgensis MS2]